MTIYLINLIKKYICKNGTNHYKSQDGEDEMAKQARLMAEKYKDGPKKKGPLVKKTQDVQNWIFC